MTSEFLKSSNPPLLSAIDGLSEKLWSLLGWAPAKKSGSHSDSQHSEPIMNGTFADYPEDETAEALDRSKGSSLHLLLKDTFDFIGQQRGLIKDEVSQLPRLHQDLKLALDLIHTQADNGAINDKEYLTERLIQIVASLPNDSESCRKVSGTLIKGLWDSLLHPPVTYLGKENQYRSADGSNNNFLYPRLGAAGTPYARSVPALTSNRPYPNPGEVFDRLLARRGKPKEHPNKISSMLFYLATIIIHDLFRTGDDSTNPDYNMSSTSSYLDLSPLYGNNTKEQLAVRALKDGLLKPDSFHEHRLLGFPPGVCALLICFNRFHNYVATRLKSINQDGRFSLSPRLSKTDAAKKLDDDLFNVARLVTSGLYVNIILGDYVRTILNMNYAPDSTWSLDPREKAHLGSGPPVPLGTGNQVSVEFNLIYRWHATLSVRDEKWTEDFFQKIFPNKDPSTMALPEFLTGLLVWRNKLMAQEPSERTFEGLKRTPSGAFETRDLAKIILESTKDVSSAFGARQVPVALKLIEVLGMEQSRQWHTGTLNELRQFVGLTPHKSFEDINPDPEIQANIRDLYKDPNLVEMYPGLVFEAAKDPYYPGSGLCGSYTTTRAILSDAATLVRSDRFYTLDWNPSVMTDWGFSLIQIGNPADQPARGGKLHTLLDIALPNVYPEDSVWKLFPFTVPDEIERIFKKQGVAGKYDFQRLI